MQYNNVSTLPLPKRNGEPTRRKCIPAQGDLNQHLVEVSVKTQLKLYIGILSIYDYDYITS